MSKRVRVLSSAAAFLVAAALGIIQSGCSGCSERAPLGFVPADAVGVVIVPHLGDALGHLKALSGNFRKSLLSGALIDRQSSLIEAEFGFDPENPETLKKVGIDHERGLVLFFGRSGEAGLVLPVADERALDGYLRRQVSKLLRGDALYRPGESRGTKLTAVTGRGKKQVAAWAFVGKHAVIAAGSSGADDFVGRLCKLERSMKKNETFVAVQDQIGESDVLAYVDGEGLRKVADLRAEQALAGSTGWAKRFIAERKKTGEAALSYFRGLGVGLSSGASSVEVSVYYVAPPKRIKVLREVLSGKGDAVPFGKLISPEALVVARASLNLRKLFERAVEILPSAAKKRIYGKLRRMEREESFSLEKDLLTVLSGRFAAAIYPPSAESVRQLVRGWRGTAHIAPAAFIAQIEDSRRASELLVRLERFLVERGAAVRVRTGGDRRVFTLERAGSAVASWTVTKKLFLLATGGRLAKTLELADKGGENILVQLQSKRVKVALKEPEGMLLTANMGKVAATISGMDLGMEAKLMLAPVMGTIGRFKEITFTAGMAEDGVVGRLAVILQSP